jgi:protein involved in polysaccharide export with SLBB domain
MATQKRKSPIALFAMILSAQVLMGQDSPPGKPPAPPAESAPYLLQAGDDLQIKAFEIPDLDQKVRVRPDGRISVLLLDEVQAAGLSVPNLSEALRAGYSQHFRNPRITVVVLSFTNQNVYVGGEVNQPRLLALTGKLSAAAAVFYAGGLKATAKEKEIIILRNNGSDKLKLFKLNLNAVLNRGAADFQLQPFDVVYVPKSRIAKLDQFVDQYLKQLQPIAMNLGFSYLLGGQNLQVVIP